MGRIDCSSQALAQHLIHVTGQLTRTENALQLRPHQCLAGAVVFAPARQWRQLPGGDLRIGGIQADYLIRQEAVARAIGRMEVDQVLPGKGTNQRTHLVGVLHGKGRMLHQRLDPLQATRQATGRLDAEPLIHDQSVVFEVLGELCQGLSLFRFERRINRVIGFSCCCRPISTLKHIGISFGFTCCYNDCSPIAGEQS